MRPPDAAKDAPNTHGSRADCPDRPRPALMAWLSRVRYTIDAAATSAERDTSAAA